jgi:hypothetical protein
MARIRTIKPEFPHSESVGKLSRDARLLFIQLWTLADDAGRARASSRVLASVLYPFDDDALGLMDGWLAELEREGMIRLYQNDGTRYLDIPKWLKHQKIDRPSKSRHPEFDEGSRVRIEGSTTDLGPRTKDLGPRTKDQGPQQPLPRQEPARAKSSLVVERVAPETQHLLGKLYAAANNNVDHSDARSRKVGPITDLENDGCNLELDILPTIKAHVPRMSTPLKSWGAPFLADHIRAARDARLAAAKPKPTLTAEEARLQRQRRSNSRYAHLGRDELIALWRDGRAEYHELETLEVDLTDPADIAELARRNEAARQFALKQEAKRDAEKKPPARTTSQA